MNVTIFTNTTSKPWSEFLPSKVFSLTQFFRKFISRLSQPAKRPGPSENWRVIISWKRIVMIIPNIKPHAQPQNDCRNNRAGFDRFSFESISGHRNSNSIFSAMLFVGFDCQSKLRHDKNLRYASTGLTNFCKTGMFFP